MGLSQKDTFKSTANMDNGHAVTHPLFKWSQIAAVKQIWLLYADISLSPCKRDNSLSPVQPRIRTARLHTLT